MICINLLVLKSGPPGNIQPLEIKFKTPKTCFAEFDDVRCSYKTPGKNCIPSVDKTCMHNKLMWVITLDPRTWWKGTDLAMTITCYTYDVAVKGALARCMHSFAPSLGAWMAATHNTCNMLSYPRKMYAFICTFAW